MLGTARWPRRLALALSLLAILAGASLAQGQPPGQGRKGVRGIIEHRFVYAQALNGGTRVLEDLDELLPRFDPARGTLLAVRVESSSVLQGSWSATNNTSQPIDIQFQAAATMTAGNLASTRALEVQPLLVAPNGTVQGTSGASAFQSTVLTGSAALPFVGTQPRPLSVNLSFVMDQLGPGNLSVNSFGSANYELRVLYYYR